MRRAAFTCLCLLLAAPVAAAAAPQAWTSIPAQSRLGFTAHWRKTPVQGSFAKFEVTARIDPHDPAGGDLSVRIDTASVTTESADVTAAIRGAQWFDAGRYPEGEFDSSAIVAKAGGAFEVRGTLKLKGHTRKIDFPLTISRKGGHLLLQGHLNLDRLDFGIGSGAWANGKTIATDVAVTFVVTLGRGA